MFLRVWIKLAIIEDEDISTMTPVSVCTCVCVHVCVHVCKCVCMCVYMCVCVVCVVHKNIKHHTVMADKVTIQ